MSAAALAQHITHLDAGDFAEREGLGFGRKRALVTSALRALHGRGATLGMDSGAAAELGLRAVRCVLTRRSGVGASADDRTAHLVALASNLPIRRVLTDAAAALTNAGVEAILYKGQDYLDRIWGDVGARGMADADLLVRESQLERAERALIEAGFEADAQCRTVHERKFVRNGVAIDLHHALLQPHRMAVRHDDLFARALPHRSIAGLRVLEATDAALIHCIAQCIRGFQLPASSFLELQALLREANMTQLLARAQAYQAQSAVYVALRMLAALGNATARAWLPRVRLGRMRRGLLALVSAPFARFLIAHVLPTKLPLLAVKTLLIDEVSMAMRFVPWWIGWQRAGPRPLTAAPPHVADLLR
jgi:hypothetical protein